MTDSDNRVFKEGWVKKQSRYLKKWRFRYAIIEGIYLKTYIKQNRKEETECIDLTKCELKYDMLSQCKFTLKFYYADDDKQKYEEFVFYVPVEQTADHWIHQIYAVQESAAEQQLVGDNKGYEIKLSSADIVDIKHEKRLKNKTKPKEIASKIDDRKCKYLSKVQNIKDIESKLEIMKLLINNIKNDKDEQMLNGIKLLINDCLNVGNEENEDEFVLPVIHEWYSLKLTEYQYVIKKYMNHNDDKENELNILYHVLFETLMIIYKKCIEYDGFDVFELLNKYIRFEPDEYKLWKILMNKKYIKKQYLEFCEKVLVFCRKLYKDKLYLFPTSFEHFYYNITINQDTVNWDIMVTDNNDNKKMIDVDMIKYYCSYPAIVTEGIHTISNDDKYYDISCLFLTKMYIVVQKFG